MPRIENSMFTPNPSYTYPGVLTTELIQKEKLGTPQLNEFFTVRTGVRSGEYLNLVQPLTRVLEKGTSTCIPTYSQSGSITDRKLTTGLFEINKSWCKKEFQGLLTSYNIFGDSSLVGDGLSGYELGGKLRSVILDEILEQARVDEWKVAFFGNNSFSSSTNVYTTIDGIWTQYLDGFGSYCIKPVTNALGNTHNSVLTANQARDTFKAMLVGAPIIMKKMISRDGSMKLFVTGSMWENYLESLETNCCVEGSWRLQQDGTKKLYYRGVELVPLWFADYALENDTDNPYYDLLRHFAILTTPKNNLFGVENAADLNNLEICYICKDKTTYIQGEMRFGVNYAQCDMTVIAY